MADNLVSQPPVNTPVVMNNGYPTKDFAIWMRDMYKRVGYKGGNAIDENKAETDKEILNLNSSLEETIEKVNENTQNIEEDAQNLSEHVSEEEAHGSNGVIVGFDDLADETTQGLVKRMSALADAIASTASVVQPDATSAPATYSQAHSQELVDLANANKASINSLVIDFNNAVTVLNNLIGQSKTSGQMTT